MRVRIGTTHPIQYQVPWFRALAARPELDLEVGFAWLPDRTAQGVGFAVPFAWDLPLLDGYRWRELERAGERPDLARFAALRLRRPGRFVTGGVDALIVTGWNSAALVQLAFAARRAGVPVLARGDSTAQRRRGVLRRALLGRLLGVFSAFLVVGESNGRFYRELGISEDRLFGVPHFVDNQRFQAAAARERARRGEIRNGWGIAADEVAVLFVGKLIEEKNVDELIEGVALARAQEPRIRLVVVGDGPLRGRLAARAAGLAVEPVWVGFLNQSELPAAYAAADLLVLPSHSESWGLVVNEALASGLAVVASDRVGCVPDLVHAGETGEVYRSGRPAELAERLVGLAREGSRRNDLATAGQRLVCDRYSVERAVAGTLEALAAVARVA